MSDCAQCRNNTGHRVILCGSISNSPLDQRIFINLGLCGFISNSPLGQGIFSDLGQGISWAGAALGRLANQPRLALVGTTGLSVRRAMLLELIIMLSWSIMAVHAAAKLLDGAVHRGKVGVPGIPKTSKRVSLIVQGRPDLEYSLALGLDHCVICCIVHKDSVVGDVFPGNDGLNLVNS